MFAVMYSPLKSGIEEWNYIFNILIVLKIKYRRREILFLKYSELLRDSYRSTINLKNLN
jgi:hypothetical protein